MVSVGELFCYPVKSVGGFVVQSLEVSRMGPVRDRQWVIVDERGMFVAQRAARGHGVALPQLCLLGTGFLDGELLLNAPSSLGVAPLRVPVAGAEGPCVDVTIWDDVVTGIDQGADASAWLGEVLGRWLPGGYRLVRMPDAGTRFTRAGDAALGFADGYPLLVSTQASLDDLNARIFARHAADGDTPPPALGWDRFRPNLVVTGAPAYAEDHWTTLRCGNVVLAGRSLCKRCPIPTIDQHTARRGHEPLRTLATYRRHPDPGVNGVVFARNFVHETEGVLKIGASLSGA